jgi:hypothetical protein
MVIRFSVVAFLKGSKINHSNVGVSMGNDDGGTVEVLSPTLSKKSFFFFLRDGWGPPPKAHHPITTIAIDVEVEA